MDASALRRGWEGQPSEAAGPYCAGWALPPAEGKYLHMDSDTFHQGEVARLRSPRIWEQGPLCVHFAYHMFGLSWGAQLRLLLLTGPKGKIPRLLWKHSNTQSPSWMPTAVTVPRRSTLPSQVRPRAGPRTPGGFSVLGGKVGADRPRRGWDKEGAWGLGHLNSSRKLGA